MTRIYSRCFRAFVIFFFLLELRDDVDKVFFHVPFPVQLFLLLFILQ